ncbi:MAG: ABC-2 transporter permease [Defluviitaleaceae bacterium]|nr:ABC-2 transporter permease [Defluviitaleaceae bacterium]
MKKTLNFMLLDMQSIKGAFGLKMFIAFAVLTVTGYTSMGVGGIFFGGVFIITQFCTQPFSDGADGLDRFYITLSLSRKQVVFGRYLFVLSFMALATLLYLVVGVVLPLILGSGVTFEHLPMMFVIYFISNFTLSVSLPVLFNLGFKKARPIAQLFPLLTVLAIALFNVGSENGVESNVAGILNYFNTLPSGVLVLFAVLICFIIFTVSLFVSLKLYAKREF